MGRSVNKRPRFMHLSSPFVTVCSFLALLVPWTLAQNVATCPSLPPATVCTSVQLEVSSGTTHTPSSRF